MSCNRATSFQTQDASARTRKTFKNEELCTQTIKKTRQVRIRHPYAPVRLKRGARGQGLSLGCSFIAFTFLVQCVILATFCCERGFATGLPSRNNSTTSVNSLSTQGTVEGSTWLQATMHNNRTDELENLRSITVPPRKVRLLSKSTVQAFVGPRIISARYTFEGTQIAVEFEEPAFHGETLRAGWFDCENVIIIKEPLGRCQWLRHMRGLLVEPTLRAPIRELAFFEGALASEPELSSLQIITVDQPVSLDLSTPLLRASSSISRSCDDMSMNLEYTPILHLDASQTRNTPLLTSISFLYRITQNEEAIQNCQFQSDETTPDLSDLTCNFDVSILDKSVSQIQVAVRVQNVFGHVSLTPWQSVTIYETNIPRLVVDQPSLSPIALADIRPVRASVEYCNGSLVREPEIYWQVRETSGTLDADLEDLMVPTADKSVVQLAPARAKLANLIGLKVQIKATASISHLSGTLSTSYIFYVTIEPSQLQVQISGGNRTIAHGDTNSFMLDGSNSLDPDHWRTPAIPLVYEWRCAPARACLAFSIHVCDIDDVPRPGSWQVTSWSGHQAPQVDEFVHVVSNYPRLQVAMLAAEKESVRNDDMIHFWLQIKAGDGRMRLVENPLQLRVVPSSMPAIAYISQVPDILSPGSTSEFHGTCDTSTSTSTKAEDPVRPVWGLKHPETATQVWFQDDDTLLHRFHHVVANGLVLLVNTTELLRNFPDEDHFTFLLQCRHESFANSAVITATVPFYPRPKGLYIAAAPYNGNVHGVKFDLSTWGWVDSNPPLRFHFQYNVLNSPEVSESLVLSTSVRPQASQQFSFPDLGGSQIRVYAVGVNVRGAMRKISRSIVLTLSSATHDNSHTTLLGLENSIPRFVVDWALSAGTGDTLQSLVTFVNAVKAQDVLEHFQSKGRLEVACALQSLMWQRLRSMVTMSFVLPQDFPAFAMEVSSVYLAMLGAFSKLYAPARLHAVECLADLVEFWARLSPLLKTLDHALIDPAVDTILECLNQLFAVERGYVTNDILSLCEKLEHINDDNSGEIPPEERALLYPLCSVISRALLQQSNRDLNKDNAQAIFQRLEYGIGSASVFLMEILLRLQLGNQSENVNGVTHASKSFNCAAWRTSRLQKSIYSYAESFGAHLAPELIKNPFPNLASWAPEILLCQWKENATEFFFQQAGAFTPVSNTLVSIFVSSTDAQNLTASQRLLADNVTVEVPVSEKYACTRDLNFGNNEDQSAAFVRVQLVSSEQRLLACGVWDPRLTKDAKDVQSPIEGARLNMCAISQVKEDSNGRVSSITCSCSRQGVISAWFLNPDSMFAISIFRQSNSQEWYWVLVLIAVISASWGGLVLVARHRDAKETDLRARGLFLLAVRCAQLERIAIRSALLELRRLRTARLRLCHKSDVRNFSSTQLADSPSRHTQRSISQAFIPADSDKTRSRALRTGSGHNYTADTAAEASLKSSTSSIRKGTQSPRAHQMNSSLFAVRRRNSSSSTKSSSEVYSSGTSPWVPLVERVDNSGNGGDTSVAEDKLQHLESKNGGILSQVFVEITSTICQHHLYLSLFNRKADRTFSRMRQAGLIGITTHIILLVSLAIANNVENENLDYYMAIVPSIAALPIGLSLRTLLLCLPPLSSVHCAVACFQYYCFGHARGYSKAASEDEDSDSDEEESEDYRGVIGGSGGGSSTMLNWQTSTQGPQIREDQRVNIRRTSLRSNNGSSGESDSSETDFENEHTQELLHKLLYVAANIRISTQKSSSRRLYPVEFQREWPLEEEIDARAFCVNPLPSPRYSIRSSFREVYAAWGWFAVFCVKSCVVFSTWAYPLSHSSSFSHTKIWDVLYFFTGALLIDVFLLQTAVALARRGLSWKHLSHDPHNARDRIGQDEDIHIRPRGWNFHGYQGVAQTARDGGDTTPSASPRHGLQAHHQPTMHFNNGEISEIELTTMSSPTRPSQDASASLPSSSKSSSDAESRLILVPDQFCVHSLHPSYSNNQGTGDHNTLPVRSNEPPTSLLRGSRFTREADRSIPPPQVDTSVPGFFPGNVDVSISPSSAGGLQAFVGFQEASCLSDVDVDEGVDDATNPDIGFDAGDLNRRNGGRSDHDDCISYDGVESTVSSYAQVPRHLLEEESWSFFGVMSNMTGFMGHSHNDQQQFDDQEMEIEEDIELEAAEYSAQQEGFQRQRPQQHQDLDAEDNSAEVCSLSTTSSISDAAPDTPVDLAEVEQETDF